MMALVRCIHPGLALASVLGVLATSAFSDESTPAPPAAVARDSSGNVTVRATRIVEPIVVDGLLIDDPYRTVQAISGLIQQEPREGEEATEGTEVWLLFDDDNIYVSARCWDSHPEREIGNEMRR